MKVSKGMLMALELVEGSSKSPYIDVAGHSTVGVGHLVLKKDTHLEIVLGKPVPSNFKLTDKQIIELLELDLGVYISAVNAALGNTKVSQNRFDALVMFTFNVGVGAFKKSSLLKKVLGSYKLNEIGDEFMRWNKARVRGVLQPVQGLTNRREVERQIFCLGTSDADLHHRFNFRINDIKFIDAAIKLYEAGRYSI